MTSRLYQECLNCSRQDCFFPDVCHLIVDQLEDASMKERREIVEGKYAGKSHVHADMKKVAKANNHYDDGDIKSTGGSSSYYTFWLGTAGWVETEEVINSMVGNDFDLGNIVKAARRIQAKRDGNGKLGTTELYDWNKIKYTAEKNIKLLEEADEV